MPHNTDETDHAVRAQYEAYPYPARDPADEAKRLIVGSPGKLVEVNHYVFGGRRDFTRPFRALSAGGGTGDAAIMMAQQLADAAGENGVAGEVVYVDVSESARRIAEGRSAARGLANISFHSLSLLDLPGSGLGPFDYIDCCGVLHHLDDPAAGLAVLASVLAPGGGMGLALYGVLGRTGVYDVQEILRALKPDGPPAERVAYARRLIERLPPGNRFRTNQAVGDHQRSDAELHDLLLNARDRAYRVPEIFELAAGAGLAVTAFVVPSAYDPSLFFDDAETLDAIERLSWPERCALAELIRGGPKLHIFYAVPAARAAEAVALPVPEAVPIPYNLDTAELARRVTPGKPVELTLAALKRSMVLPDQAAEILALMDGRRSLGDIHAALRVDDPELDWETFAAIFGLVYHLLNGGGALFLAMGDT